jgi:hypothetical protein
VFTVNPGKDPVSNEYIARWEFMSPAVKGSSTPSSVLPLLFCPRSALSRTFFTSTPPTIAVSIETARSRDRGIFPLDKLEIVGGRLPDGKNARYNSNKAQNTRTIPIGLHLTAPLVFMTGSRIPDNLMERSMERIICNRVSTQSSDNTRKIRLFAKINRKVMFRIGESQLPDQYSEHESTRHSVNTTALSPFIYEMTDKRRELRIQTKIYKLTAL